MMGAADEEIEAAGVRGVDAALLAERRDLLGAYYHDLAEGELRRAERLFERGLRKEAMEALEKAAKVAPFSASAHRHLGLELVKEGKHEDGLWELDRALALGIENPDVRYHRGVALHALKRREEALAAFRAYREAAGDAGPHSADAERRIRDIVGNVEEARLKELESQARDAFRRRNWDEAIARYRLLLERAPAEKESLYYIAEALIEKGEIFEGYASYRRYLDAEPSGRRAGAARREIRGLERKWTGTDASRKAFGKGLAEYAAGNYMGAAAYFSSVVEEAPLAPEGYLQRGISRLRIGEMRNAAEPFQEALADLNRCLFLTPDDAVARESLSLCQYHLADYDHALENARAVMDARPTGWIAHYVAGMVHVVRREYERALEALSEGIKRAPGEVRLFIARAEAYEGLERFAEAGTDLETAKRKGPTWEEEQRIKQIEERLAGKR
jgi:tetratricopeptide (TPR) repeat protein